MEKEKIRDIVKREFDSKPLGSRSEYTIKDIQDSLVEALHKALSMSGVGCMFYCQRGDVTGSKRCEKQCEAL